MSEHERVVLVEDVPEARLRAGDVGTIVHVYRDDAAYEVEFVTLAGVTEAVVTLAATEVRAVGPSELTHSRNLVA
jgi:hypothetical protein